MYDITEGHVFLLFALVLAMLVGYIVYIFFGLLYGFLAGLFVLFLFVGGALFHSTTNLDKVIGSVIMATGIGIVFCAIFGCHVGIPALLISLAYFLLRILLSQE